ncbi:hypothetical protein D3C76_791840 [compost metagenome]
MRVFQRGQAVDQDGVDAAVAQVGELARVILVGAHVRFRHVLLHPLFVVGAQAHADLLACQVLRGLDVQLFGLLLQDQRLNARDGVGLGEVVLLLALFGNGHLVDHHIQPLGLQCREDAIPFGRLNFSLDPQLLGQQLGKLDFEAAQLAVFVLEAEGRVGAFQADVDHALFLDGLQLLAGERLAEQAGTQQDGQAGVE